MTTHEQAQDFDQDSVRQILLETSLERCRKLNIQVIAEGIESLGKLRTLQAMGMALLQSHLLAKPAFGSLPDAHLTT
ncbi:EAL domain-containing protein [uncultured Pseudomonas sp.]|uniref:EAL domain-containing protein n=1 Tax=uncultured Pseudomonas sp. TaxID=114707 RepID=UPI003455BE4B